MAAGAGGIPLYERRDLSRRALICCSVIVGGRPRADGGRPGPAAICAVAARFLVGPVPRASVFAARPGAANLVEPLAHVLFLAIGDPALVGWPERAALVGDAWLSNIRSIAGCRFRPRT